MPGRLTLLSKSASYFGLVVSDHPFSVCLIMLKQHLGVERNSLPLLASDRRSRIRIGMVITLRSFS
jgi:hypothetical protein